jgi:segregation and condensation protein B
MEQQQLKRILEAALLAAAQPLSLPQLSALFVEPDVPTHEDLARALEQLGEECADRGIELKEVASGFRYQVRQDVNAWVARLWTERQTKYSRALLETLALIAYRQPITRGEIEQIRGVAVSTNIVKTLEEREWIRVVGYRDVPGKPELFGTTKGFLDYFVLKSLDELPPLAEIRDVEEFDAQLTLGPTALADAVDEDADAEEQPHARDVAADAGPAAENEDPDNPVTQAAAAADSATPEHNA